MAGWPTANDYSLAVAKRAFVHPRLAGLTFRRMKRINRPVLFTGNYAATFALEDPSGRPKALKLFTRHVPDRADRYAAIAAFLTERTPRQFVGFEYLPQAVQIEGVRYPGLLMDWADGVPLDTYVSANLDTPEALRKIAADILAFTASTEQQGFAHGDLQHDNILVADRLRLIDYDGMFVPAMAGRPAVESGHQNYQHPGRRRQVFGPHIDRFSAIAIYLALQTAIMAPRLYAEHAVENGLLFRKSDFEDPRKSAVIAALDRLRPLRPAARAFAALCAGDVEAVPSLADFAAQTGIGPRAPARPDARPAAGGGWRLFGWSGRSSPATTGSPSAPPAGSSGGAGRGLGPWRPAAWSAAIVVAYLAGAHLLRQDAEGPAAPTIAAPSIATPDVAATPMASPPPTSPPPASSPPDSPPSVSLSPAEAALPAAPPPTPADTVVGTPAVPQPAPPMPEPAASPAPPSPGPSPDPVGATPPSAVPPTGEPPGPQDEMSGRASAVPPVPSPAPDPMPSPAPARSAPPISPPAVAGPTPALDPAKAAERPACAGRELAVPAVTPQSEGPPGEGPATRAEWRCITPDQTPDGPADRAAPEPPEPPIATTGRTGVTRPARAVGPPTRHQPRSPGFRPPEPRKPVFDTPLD
ncbi:hypothetical protein [Rhodoplanes azumiensis]|uniref:Protein kinase domain-containing protein n=1 Tax=Rhodoplanes azumiensis TaxID=1897628 RepID=A0ABW5AJ03_9BRAD